MPSLFSRPKKTQPAKTKKTGARKAAGNPAPRMDENEGSIGTKRVTNPEFVGVFGNKSDYRKAQKGDLRMAKMRGEVIDPQEFRGNDATWRIFRIMSEFVDGYDFLAKIRADVTVFGSARMKPGSEPYENAHELGRLLAENGFSVITGGGPGIMEAANKGAFEAGGESIGLNIQLPFEQRINPFVRHGIGFHYFFTRKVMLTAPSQAFVALPGGIGTLDEVFEVLTLMQTGKMAHVPMIFLGKDFWSPLQAFLETTLLEHYGTVSEEDLKLFTIVDTPEEAVEIIMQRVRRDGEVEEAHESEVHTFQTPKTGE